MRLEMAETSVGTKAQRQLSRLRGPPSRASHALASPFAYSSEASCPHLIPAPDTEVIPHVHLWHESSWGQGLGLIHLFITKARNTVGSQYIVGGVGERKEGEKGRCVDERKADFQRLKALSIALTL